MMKLRLLFIFAVTALLPVCTAQASHSVVNLKVSGLSEPLGIDSTPTFGWQTRSEERGFHQSAYKIVVTNAEGLPIWDSGVVASAQQTQVAYTGPSLSSCSHYDWTVSVFGADGTMASSSSFFETAFLSADEWTARWITRNVESQKTCMSIALDGVESRYIRLDVTKLGIPASSEPTKYYLQLAEMEIYSNGENVALKAERITVSNDYEVGTSWSKAYLNDGLILSSGPLGYTTYDFSNADQHVSVVVKLDKVYSIDKVVLYPRQDEHASTDATRAANFPASFTIQTSATGSGFATAYTATDAEAPLIQKADNNIPYFAKSIQVGKTVKRARLYAAALGVFNMKINGQPITENRLEPGETQYTKTVLYNSYDVTNLLHTGTNALLAQVAGALFNIAYLDGIGGLTQRYSKRTLTNSGPASLKAELLVEYADGTSERFITDGSWKTANSPSTGSNWWGGEDYNATLEIDNIDSSDFDFSAWENADEVAPTFAGTIDSGSIGVLKSKMNEPLRVVEQWKAVSVTPLTVDGKQAYRIDFGRNFAGQYEFCLKGEKGQIITLRPGEKLNADGTVVVDYWNTPPYDNYDSYTFAGKADGETWGPSFMYHGCRYLQVLGLTKAPNPNDFTALRIRANMDQSGNFSTSNQLINDIHTICRDGIQSQLYNTVTDCPHREKLGWMDVPNQMFNSISYNYDVQNLMSKIADDCADAQQANGMMPSTVPHYMTDWDDDANWGGSAILVPYRSWKLYGNRSIVEKHYDTMKALIDYYTSRTSNYILQATVGLSDWGQGSAGLSKETTANFTVTATYYYMLRVMAEVAAELGKPDEASSYAALADKVRTAFNNKYFTASTSVYEYGNQAEYAMPLYYGLVLPENEEAVARKLAEAVTNAGYKIKTGEIGLKPVLVSLAKYGYNDIVYQMANQTDYPSYGYWVKQGATTTPELWNMNFSQNHCMMDHIEEWFYAQIGGITNAGMAYDSISIRPYIPSDLTSMSTSVGSPYGTITSEYTGQGDSQSFHFVIPENTVATIVLPLQSDKDLYEKGIALSNTDNSQKPDVEGVESVCRTDSLITITLGSGDYAFNIGNRDLSAIDSPTTSTLPSAYYSLAGTKVDRPTNRGIYIATQGTESRKFHKK